MEKRKIDQLRFAKRLHWRRVLSTGVIIYASADGEMNEKTIYWPSDDPKNILSAAELVEGRTLCDRTLMFMPCDGSECSFATGCPCGDK